MAIALIPPHHNPLKRDKNIMNIESVEKKLREAQFFLSKMTEQEQRAFGEREPFDFYLSAFLSAARSIDYRLRHEQKAIYPVWRSAWNAKLSLDEDKLIKHMVDDRANEVHESGSGRSAGFEGIAVMGGYSDPSGTLTIFAPPGTPPAVFNKPAYYFTLGGTNHKVTVVCAKYLALLDRMIAAFKADNP